MKEWVLLIVIFTNGSTYTARFPTIIECQSAGYEMMRANRGRISDYRCVIGGG